MNRAIVYAAVPFAYAAGICFAAVTTLFVGSVYLMQPIVKRLQRRNTCSSTAAPMHKKWGGLFPWEAPCAPLCDEYGHQTSLPPALPQHRNQSVALFTDREESSHLIRKIEDGFF